MWEVNSIEDYFSNYTAKELFEEIIDLAKGDGYDGWQSKECEENEKNAKEAFKMKMESFGIPWD